MKKVDTQKPDADRLAGDLTPAALPADLVRALEWLRCHLSEAVDLEQLASVAGVRPRTLESHFKTFLGTSPLGWLRQTRFANARRALESGRADATVTRIALANGFGQLGRFAAEYRAIFGETPSATLRRSRSRLEGGDEAIDDEAFRLTWQAIPSVFAIAPRECSEAIATLESVRQLAPGYGLPVALAAWCLGQRAAHGFSAIPEQDRDMALQLVAQAQTLAPNDALALTLASGALTLTHRLDDADRLLERALALDPWLPYAWIRRGWASTYVGDPGAAFRELSIALRLAPVGPMRQIAFIGIGCAHFACERYERAARWVQNGTESFPGAVWADRISIAAAVHAGSKDEARRIARRLMRKDPHLTVGRARNAWPFPPAFMARLADGLATAGVPRS
ncbi:MAG TPA: helix-turn-helix domain-containing protein [Pseudolabrys sp.]|nr:helix-turn-helix domain-containing protein [Pseudolabrys sp.]